MARSSPALGYRTEPVRPPVNRSCSVSGRSRLHVDDVHRSARFSGLVRKATTMASTSFSRRDQMSTRIRSNGSEATSPVLHQVTAEGESAVHSIPDQDAAPPFVTQIGATSSGVEMINSAELARRLGVPESWVRSRSNPNRTADPIPHYKFGRYVQFPWGSDVLRVWLNRQLVSTDRAGHSRRNE